MLEKITTNLSKLNYFSSIYDVKVLAYLICHPVGESGKTISTELNISDSKIYPALNRLVDQGLILKSDTERPHRYYLAPPEIVIGYLEQEYETEQKYKAKLVSSSKKLIYLGWNQAQLYDNKMGEIFSDQSIITQVRSLELYEAEEIVIFVGSKAISYTEPIVELIVNHLGNVKKVKLAIPHSQKFVDAFRPILQRKHQNLELKQSNIKNESYIVLDNSLLFNINHQLIGDIGFYTNDQRLIRNAVKSWDKQDVATRFHRILRYD